MKRKIKKTDWITTDTACLPLLKLSCGHTAPLTAFSNHLLMPDDHWDCKKCDKESITD